MYATTPEIKSDMKVVNQSFGDAIRSTSIVAKGSNLEEALQVNDALYHELNKMQEEGLIQSFHSLSPLLPSNKQQEANRHRWLEFWHKDRVDSLNTVLLAEGRELRMKPEFFADFFKEIPGATEPLSIETYNGSFLEKMFQTQIGQNNGVLALSSIKLHDYSDFLRLQKRLKNFENIIMLNGRYFVTYVVNFVRSELTQLGLYSLLAVSTILLLFYGFRLGLLMLLPLFVSLLWTFGLLGWFKIPINLMNCVLVLFVFGLVMDCSVFLSSAFQQVQKKAQLEFLERSSGAVAVSSITTILGVGVLALTQHPSLYIVGITVLIGMSAGFAAILLVIPLCANLAFFQGKKA